ncbi:TPA: restriction endonuclease subunit S [Salmonella enterica]|nr:restriction endonuclease subunit S [Salmonella enterica]MCH5735961.1 restriction endonuclease subunit S [Salmonella enterica]MCH5745684.1 restriction endonuclease subunit S [Salmonella enterica]MCH5765904.1 restriction endonuclease subunit S [Salmonella enterica]HCC3965083.1 restriction endonuclease subunit S [Salmonella enterica]
MSEMSYLEKLLDGADVQWKTIGDVSLSTSNIKWREAKRTYRYIDLTSVDIETKRITETSEITADNAPSRAQKIIEKNDILFATTRPTQQRFCLIDDEYSGEIASTGYCVLRPRQDEVLPGWILHWVSSSYFKKYVEENQSGSAYPAISDSKVRECRIPIPCPDNPEKSLAIQSEIVRILDKFTALTAELTAELNARQKQYNYYRDLLLTFDGQSGSRAVGQVRWTELNKVASYSKTRIHFNKLDDTNYVSVDNLLQNCAGKTNSNYVPREGNLTEYLKDDILIGNIRPYLKKIWHSDRTGGTNGDVLVIHPTNEAMNPRYLYHVLADEKFFAYNMQHAKGAKMPRGNKESIMKYRIPVPSLTEQIRIVSILDKFDTLTTSITEGLPREIELRQKQYEYYRDLLLSFPKSEAIRN